MGLLAPDLCARAEHRDPCCGNSETNQKNYTEFTVSKRIRIREQNPTKNKEKKKTSISFFLSFFPRGVSVTAMRVHLKNTGD